MTPMNCRDTETLLAARNLADLMAHEREAVSVHLAQCDSCRMFRDTAESLALLAPGLEPVDLDALSSRRFARAAIEGRLPESSVPLEKPRQRMLLSALAAVLIASVGLTLWWRASDSPPAENAPHPIHNAPIAVALVPSAAQSLAIPENGSSFSVSASSRIWTSPTTVVYRDPARPEDVHLRMSSGLMVVDVNHRIHRGAFIVRTPRCDVEVRGTLFSVAIENDSREIIRVINGTVAVTERAVPDEVLLVETGQEFITGDRTPHAADEEALARDLGFTRPIQPAPVVTTRQLNRPNSADLADRAITDARLSEAERHIAEAATSRSEVREVPGLLCGLARAYRKEKQFSRARETYERLFREYPASDAALDANVALAQLELTVLGDPQSALRHFSLYLDKRPEGYLADEAHLGIAGAYGKSGNPAGVIETAERYLATHPSGVYRAEMTRLRDAAILRREGTP